ncbi:GMP synthase [Dictyobacter alpinus]|uniref:GMP synthase n=1 Tax=Dictyobacter alpinus TaxID=2014873 RepID=A0A402B2D6_9CHLR|nr:type 1 glutamine amidotransferase [Dictyobacter alpinus]GCE25467.1 GMP synthase [Dictyobacter alpinus]
MPDKKHVLVLQHFRENPPGRVGNLLDEHMIPYDLIHVGQDALPDPAAYGAIIVLGGTQHLYDKSHYPYSVHEEIYIHRAIKDRVPYLGMCLGGQLLANTFKAPVRKLPKEHIGFLGIEFTEAGQKDPLYHGLPGHQQAFQWHEDCFELPHGAVSLAHHEDGANQGFRYLNSAYGLQYHIELTEEMLDQWLHDPALKQEFIAAYGIEQYEKVEREAVELYPTYASHAQILVENFLRLSMLIP